MKTSRNYVKAVLVEEKKENTKLFKGMEEAPHKFSTGPQFAKEVDMEQFSDEELVSLSRMKFKLLTNPTLSIMAKKELAERKSKEVKSKEISREGRTSVGPEPW